MCESGQWSLAVDPDCLDFSFAADKASHVAVPALLVILVAVMITQINRWLPSLPRPQAQERLFRHMLDHAPRGMNHALDLFGWRDFHERLLEKERQLLRGEDMGSPVVHAINFHSAAPTAPEPDEDDSSAPSMSDPRALASAPAFHLERVGRKETIVSSQAPQPSAPPFEDEEREWTALGTLSVHIFT